MDPAQKADLQRQMAAAPTAQPPSPRRPRSWPSERMKEFYLQSLRAAAAAVPSPEGCGCAAGKARGLRWECMRLFGDERKCRELLTERVWAMAEDPRQSPIERGFSAVSGALPFGRGGQSQ